MSTIVLITAGKELVLKLTTSAFRHRPIGGRYMCRKAMLGDFYLPPPPPISTNFLFVKISADFIITKLKDSTHVNFSQ